MTVLDKDVFADFMKQMFLFPNATITMTGTTSALVGLIFGDVLMDGIPINDLSLFVTGMHGMFR